MIKLVFLILLFFYGGETKDVSKINELKKQAQEAYQNKDFAAASVVYQKLINDFQVEDERILINLANVYYQLEDTANASIYYQKAVSVPNKNIKSQALTQLGVMSHKKQNLEPALALFKEALKTDPSNEAARYNFELVKKQVNKQKEQNKEDQKKDEEKIEPSEFAKQLKEKAEKLVSERKYHEAFSLMINGTKQDQTVAHYKDFISRINDIIEIEK
ncbi:MAG: tetratricopeptide repeat protein [Bacteroidota bacterium]|nr:tetratricopeptide repeat protein [Bacteroidota bacterium]